MMKRFITLLVIISAACMIIGCDSVKTDIPTQIQHETDPTPMAVETHDQQEESEIEQVKTEVIDIRVTSESLTPDGKWLTVINSAQADPPGSNLTPQLSWDKVEGAEFYAIYMVDNSASYWLHWRAKNVKETSLPLGAELEESSYIGPYPPSGTHEYEVIVYALKQAPAKYPGTFDSAMTPLGTIEQKLDTIDGVPGNIIGKGSIRGTVIVGETVE